MTDKSSFILALAVLVSFVLGFFQFRQEAAGLYEALRQNLSHPAAVSVNINRSLGDSENNSPGQRSEKEENTQNLLLLLSSLAVFASSGSLTCILLLTALVGVGFLLLKTKEREKSFYSQLRYYRRWWVKFLNPIQRSILNRADIYDINRIGKIFRKVNPRNAFSAKSAGFFIDQ